MSNSNIEEEKPHKINRNNLREKKYTKKGKLRTNKIQKKNYNSTGLIEYNNKIHNSIDSINNNEIENNSIDINIIDSNNKIDISNNEIEKLTEANSLIKDNFDNKDIDKTTNHISDDEDKTIDFFINSREYDSDSSFNDDNNSSNSSGIFQELNYEEFEKNNNTKTENSYKNKIIGIINYLF